MTSTELEEAIKYLTNDAYREHIDGDLDYLNFDETFKVVLKAATRTAELERALRWYADKANYCETWHNEPCGCCSNFDHSETHKDEGQRARDALGEG
jgi:hypothetical protein